MAQHRDFQSRSAINKQVERYEILSLVTLHLTTVTLGTKSTPIAVMTLRPYQMKTTRHNLSQQCGDRDSTGVTGMKFYQDDENAD